MDIKRAFDLTVAATATVLLTMPMVVVAFLVKATSDGPALYWSQRVGRNNKLFWMPKFRTMETDTPVVATHLLTEPSRHLTPIGSILRKTSLDELPQLWSILKGDMSLVGPRPALYSQDDLISARTERGVNLLLPGLTGWAQVNGRDDLEIPQKVALDAEYLARRNFLFDLRILFMTVIRVAGAVGVRH